MTREQVEALTHPQIVQVIRLAAEYDRTNKAITWEHGTDIVNIIAMRGDEIADVLEEH